MLGEQTQRVQTKRQRSYLHMRDQSVRCTNWRPGADSIVERRQLHLQLLALIVNSRHEPHFWTWYAHK